MSLNDYEIKIEARKKGNHHNSGYCSDPCDFVDIDEDYSFSIDVPNKKFVKDFVYSDGEINPDCLMQYNKTNNIYDETSRKCGGSGYCGCEIKTTIKSAKLVKLSNIKDKFLNEISSDEEDQCFSKSEVTSFNTSVSKTKLPSLSRTKPKTNYVYDYSNPKKYMINSGKKKYPKHYNESYIERCSKIPCKFLPNCKYQYDLVRPCMFNHS